MRHSTCQLSEIASHFKMLSILSSVGKHDLNLYAITDIDPSEHIFVRYETKAFHDTTTFTRFPWKLNYVFDAKSNQNISILFGVYYCETSDMHFRMHCRIPAHLNNPVLPRETGAHDLYPRHFIYWEHKNMSYISDNIIASRHSRIIRCDNVTPKVKWKESLESFVELISKEMECQKAWFSSITS